MTDIPKERREELRRRAREANFDGGAMLPWDEIHALLDMADGRDRLWALLEDVRDVECDVIMDSTLDDINSALNGSQS